MKIHRIQIDSNFKVNGSTHANCNFLINYDLHVNLGHLYIDNFILLDSSQQELLTIHTQVIRIVSDTIHDMYGYDISTNAPTNLILFIPKSNAIITTPNGHIVFKNTIKDGITIRDFNLQIMHNFKLQDQDGQLLNNDNIARWYATLIIEEYD